MTRCSAGLEPGDSRIALGPHKLVVGIKKQLDNVLNCPLRNAKFRPRIVHPWGSKFKCQSMIHLMISACEHHNESTNRGSRAWGRNNPRPSGCTKECNKLNLVRLIRIQQFLINDWIICLHTRAFYGIRHARQLQDEDEKGHVFISQMKLTVDDSGLLFKFNGSYFNQL